MSASAQPEVSQYKISDSDLVIKKALAARNAGRAAEAIELVEQALTREQHNARLWQTLGLLHRALSDSAAAIQAFDRASQLDPTDVRIAHAHARVTMEAGLPSLSLFERARKLAPLDGDLLISRAAAQLAEGQGKEAVQELDENLKTNPQWVQGQVLLANLRWMLGDKENYAQGYERALQQFPADLNLWLSMIEWLIRAELFQTADAGVARARSAVGNHMALDANEAVCASELGDASRADQLFDRLSQVADVPLIVRHIRHLLRTGRVKQAAQRAEPLIQSEGAGQVWPYIATIWRLLDDERWRWLEDDPRLVGVYDIGDPVKLDALATRLRLLHNTAAYPVGQSVRGGTQTDGPLFARIEPEIQDLRELLARTVEDHLSQLGEPDPLHPVLSQRRYAPIRFSGSWSVRLVEAGRHTNHIHPLGWFSSAFYVSMPDQAEMGPAPAGWLALGQPPAELGLDLPPFRTIKARPGRLALFPSIMWHGTVPFEAGERLTVAFDVGHPPISD